MHTQLEISISTVRNIMHRFTSTNVISKGKKGCSKFKIDPDLEEAVLEHVGENPIKTQEEIQKFFVATISNKSVRLLVESKNCDRVKNLCKE